VSTAHWFEGRVPAPPAALAARLAEAASDGTEPEALAAAALERLGAAIAACPSRNAALDLLAADGLLTYVFEAAAERGLAELAAALDSLPPARFAALAAADGAGESHE
jgi:hypothetical protein